MTNSPGRSVLVLFSVPSTMLADDVTTLRRKLSAQSTELLDFLAHQIYSALRDPDATPEQMLARVVESGNKQG